MEILAAITVLAFILTILSQILGHTQNMSNLVMKHIDATQSARRVFDTLVNDMANAVAVNGGVVLVSAPSKVAFLKNGRGPSTAAESRYLSVQYTLRDHAVIRAYSAVSWANTGMLETVAQTPEVETVLANGILQMGIIVEIEDGTHYVLGDLPASALLSEGSSFQQQVVPQGWSALVPVALKAASNAPRARSFVISIATVDEATFGIMTESEKALFGPPATLNPRKEWEEALATATVSNPVRGAVRFYTKVITLP